MNVSNIDIVPIRYWLLGREYHLALMALEYASKLHSGVRKDGVTPEFNHQLCIMNYIRSLHCELMFPEETLAAAALHDVCEDYDIGFEEIEAKFGEVIREAVFLLTKKHRGNLLEPNSYYTNLSDNAIASIVKGADRIHNIQTMTEVFSLEKQNKYIDETENLVLPMLKLARRKFTKQEPVYENSKLVLRSQIELIKSIHSAKKEK